jgi:hypothetical protein
MFDLPLSNALIVGHFEATGRISQYNDRFGRGVSLALSSEFIGSLKLLKKGSSNHPT